MLNPKLAVPILLISTLLCTQTSFGASFESCVENSFENFIHEKIPIKKAMKIAVSVCENMKEKREDKDNWLEKILVKYGTQISERFINRLLAKHGLKPLDVDRLVQSDNDSSGPSSVEEQEDGYSDIFDPLDIITTTKKYDYDYFQPRKRYSSICATQFGDCHLPRPGEVGLSCYCRPYYGPPVGGQVRQ